ncbi:MAG: hypothetical protein GXP62_13635 [Oligoflexia bacterium]|nr:hypothetical protein [Oligoflexia bacterium]
MGIRDRLSRRLRTVVDRFSGEYSEPAPDEIEPYDRPGQPSEDANVVMARLHRPSGRRGGGSTDKH